MAITALGHEFWYPSIPEFQTGGTAGGTGTVVLNASGDKVGFVFPCPKTGTLDKAEILIGAVSNNPDNGIRISFQGVDSAGLPDGVQDQYRDVTGSPIPTGWTVPGLMTNDGTDGGSKRSVTIGELIAVCIEFVTFVASDSIAPGIMTMPSNYMTTLSAWTADGSTGTYSKSTTQAPIVVLKYNDGTYAVPAGTVGIMPISAFTTTNFNSGSTPDEYAARFSLAIKARAVGAWARIDVNDNTDIVLYSGTTAERTISIDEATNSRVAVPGIHFGYFSTPYELLASTVYRVAVKPTTTTNISIYRFSHGSSGIVAAWAGGAEWYESTRTDAGAWSDNTTGKLWAGLIIDGFDTSGGGGGGTRGYVG